MLDGRATALLFLVEAHARGAPTPLLLLGPEGSGKTTMMVHALQMARAPSTNAPPHASGKGSRSFTSAPTAPSAITEEAPTLAVHLAMRPGTTARSFRARLGAKLAFSTNAYYYAVACAQLLLVPLGPLPHPLG